MLDKIKQLGKDTAIYGISTIVGRFLNFLLVPLYANFIIPSEYGILGNTYANIAFINIFFIYGMDVAYMKFASLEKENSNSFFSLSFLSVLITSVLFSSLILFAKNPILVYLNASESYNYIVYLIAPIILLDALTVIPFANLRLQRKAKKFATIRFFNIIINVTTNIILFVFLQMKLEAIFISNLVASAFSLICLLPEIKSSLEFNFNLSRYKSLFKFGITFLPASLTSLIIQAFDKPLMAKLAGNHVAGIYNVNYKLGILMMLVVTMFQYAWQPFFLDNSKEKEARKIFAKILTLFLMVMASLWVFLTLFLEDLVRIPLPGRGTIIPESYLGGIGIVPVILLAYIFNGLYVNFSAGVVIENKTRYLFVITSSGALINIIINLVYIPVYNIWAGAFAALASYIVMAIGIFIYSRKHYKIDYEYGKIAGIFFVMGIIWAGLGGINILGIENIFTKLFLLFAFPILIFLLKIVEVDELKKLIRTILKGRNG